MPFDHFCYQTRTATPWKRTSFISGCQGLMQLNIKTIRTLSEFLTRWEGVNTFRQHSILKSKLRMYKAAWCCSVFLFGGVWCEKANISPINTTDSFSGKTEAEGNGSEAEILWLHLVYSPTERADKAVKHFKHQSQLPPLLHPSATIIHPQRAMDSLPARRRTHWYSLYRFGACLL